MLVLEVCKPEPSQPFDMLQASAVRVRLAGSMQVQLHVSIVRACMLVRLSEC